MSDRNEICAALIQAQGKFRPILRTATNPHFRSKYATLDAIIDATRDALGGEGLAVSQLLTPQNTLRTVLMHISGQTIESEINLFLNKQDSQGNGSAITYARRYALSAILGVASEDDDDGNASAKPGKSTTTSTEERIRSICGECQTEEDWRQAKGALKAQGLLTADGIRLVTDLWAQWDAGREASELDAAFEKQINQGE